MKSTLRIATRESKLALWQANDVKQKLQEKYPDLDVQVLGMTTAGDRNKHSPLSQLGGKGVFVKELEVALMEDRADIAVHSMKDVPGELPGGLDIGAICLREDPRDALVSNEYSSLAEIPSGGRIGSSSLRRRLQLKQNFQSLRFTELRGNVDTRLGRLDAGDFDGIILATAGLKRLGLAARIADRISSADCVPAAGQGAVGIECREGDSETRELINSIADTQTMLCVGVERQVTLALGATCNLPVGVFAELDGQTLKLSAYVASLDGSRAVRVAKEGNADKPDELAAVVLEALNREGAAALIKSS